MVTSSTAPGRPKVNRWTLRQVTWTAGNVGYYDFDLADENGVAQNGGGFTLAINLTEATGITYSAQGVPSVVAVSYPSGGITTDFTTFSNTAGGFAAKAAALEARLQSTGRIPA
jgi:hypothetical protein